MIKHLIFDWDGTIQDTISSIVEAWQLAAQEMQLAIPDAATIRSMIGLSLSVGINKLEPQLSAAGEQTFIDTYRKHYFALEQQPSPLYDDIPELIEQLKARELLLTVATGKGRNGLDRAMANSGIGHHFSASRTAPETASKPDPLMVNQLCKQMGIAPANSLVVGDAYFDMAMARNAGAIGIGVSYGAGTLEALNQGKPKVIIDKPLQLLDLL